MYEGMEGQLAPGGSTAGRGAVASPRHLPIGLLASFVSKDSKLLLHHCQVGMYPACEELVKIQAVSVAVGLESNLTDPRVSDCVGFAHVLVQVSALASVL